MTDVFSCCEEAVGGMSRALETNGVEYITESISGQKTRKKCREIVGYSCQISGWGDREQVRERLGEKNYRFLQMEFKEWLDRNTKNPGRAWREDPETWAPFLTDDGQFNYTYKERFFSHPKSGSFRGSQVDEVVDLLARHPDTRQAFISIWQPKDLLTANNISLKGAATRVPCTIGYQFLIRPVPNSETEDRLELVYSMRSLNATWNLWNDLYLVTRLFEYVQDGVSHRRADRGWERGPLANGGVVHLHAGSLHSFEELGND